MTEAQASARRPPVLSVLVVNESIADVGVLVNAAFVLGLSAGRRVPDHQFGPSAVDADGQQHAPLTSIPHYVREASRGQLRTLRGRARSQPDVEVHDYPEEAAPSTYAEYTEALSKVLPSNIIYRAVHVIGPAEIITPWTKNLSRR